MTKAEDLFSAVFGKILTLHDTPTKVKQIIISDLLITLTMEAIVLLSFHIGFHIREKKDLSQFLQQLRELLNKSNGDAIKKTLGDKKEIITQELTDLFQKNGFPKENTIKVSSQIVEKIKSLF